MGKRGDISQGKLASGLLASGLVAASLGVVGPANASCVNFGGIAIGEGAALHCQASFGSIAIVIGPTPADGPGSDAFAGNPSEFGLLNFAISVGGTATQRTNTSAGQLTNTGLPNIGNTSFATAGSQATTAGLLNLGASLGGTRSQVFALGAGNSGINLGSDNTLAAAGVVNNATNLSGNENLVGASNTPGTGLAALVPGLNVAFNTLGTNNTVQSGAGLAGAIPGFPPTGGNGPLAIAGAILVNDQNLANGTDLLNNNFGIELRTPFNEQGTTTTTTTTTTPTSLAGGNKVAPTTFAAGSFNRAGSQLSASLTNAGTQFRSSLNSLSKTFSDTGSSLNSLSKTFSDTGSSLNSLSKTFSDTVKSDTVKKVTGGLAGGPKAGADSTSSSDE